MTNEPPIRFTPWTHWPERNRAKNAHLPGVYLIARWEVAPPDKVDALAQAIVYVGEITEGSLMGRWQQFARAAFEGKPGHAGGMKYRDIFGDEGDTLYVAAFVPEGLSREMRSLYIRYVERKLVWEWARRWGDAPLCNTK